MKKQKGVTLLAVTVYVIVMVIAIGVIATITSFFYSNTKQIEADSKYASQFDQFNVFFLEDTKEYNNQVSSYTANFVAFSNGNTYRFDAEKQAIYRNEVKICSHVKNAIFTYQSGENNSTVSVALEIGGETQIAFSKTVSYTIVNPVDTSGGVIADGSFNQEKGVNTPVLIGDMKPVIWDASNNEINNMSQITNENWYDYNQQGYNNASRWANAKTADGSYWVWIPRFEYKIIRAMDNSEGFIEIKFIPTSQTQADKDFTIHPVFTTKVEDGGWKKEIPGFWVAKYEASNNSETPKSTFGVSSWRNLTIGDCYTKAYNYDRAKESHLMKNSEWGAVAYLAHSSYGRDAIEVSSNESTEYYTGGGAEEAYKTNLLQSTTGNITGIYDLNGGTMELLAVWNNVVESSLLVYGQSFASSGGTSTIYATAYSNNQSLAGSMAYTQEVAKIGDATYEIAQGETYTWFGDACIPPTTNLPFLGRGGTSGMGDMGGIFSSVSYNGISNVSGAFRMILTP